MFLPHRIKIKTIPSTEDTKEKAEDSKLSQKRQKNTLFEAGKEGLGKSKERYAF